MRRPSRPAPLACFLAAAIVGATLYSGAVGTPTGESPGRHEVGDRAAPTNDSAVSNFSAAVGRLVTLVGAAGGGLLSLVWARVALSWFSHDSMKKVLAKERARDALVGTLLFVAAISGLVWALAHWVLTGG